MNYLDRAACLALLVVGTLFGSSGVLASDGSIDPSFGQDGVALTAPGQWDHIAGNGRGAFAVAGPCLGEEVGTNPCFQLADSAGNPDPAFNGGSSITLTNPPCDIYQFQMQTYFNLLLDSQGRIIVVADCLNFEEMFAVRFDTSGQRDLTFGENGYETFPDCPGQSYSYQSAIDTSDRLVLALQCGAIRNYVVSRRNSDGTPDTNFGSGGYATLQFSTLDDRFLGGVCPGCFALDHENRSVLLGTCGPGSAPYTCVTRFDAEGQVESAFGTDGIAAVPTAAGSLYAN